MRLSQNSCSAQPWRRPRAKPIQGMPQPKLAVSSTSLTCRQPPLGKVEDTGDPRQRRPPIDQTMPCSQLHQPGRLDATVDLPGEGAELDLEPHIGFS